ncbi:MAG: hypothetical protein KIH64_015140 [Mycobacterium sp.]|nr:hypothetical protein [Mycobacterium sp.]
MTNLLDQLHDPYADHDDELTAKRSELLTHLTYGIRVMEHAAELLDDLRSGAAEDVELVEGRDGRDCAAHLDAAVRTARAAYAVLHVVFEKERP